MSTDEVCGLSCNVDDMTAEEMGFAMEQLLHGGALEVYTTPIGMKKFFRTFVDESVRNFPTFCFSAGKIGYQVETSPQDLARIIRFDTADLTAEEEA